MCEKYFKDEETLEEHKKIRHSKFECDECEKEFTYEAVLVKHKEEAHESVELFCHYFNNDKDCPFDDQCIFIHEESPFVSLEIFVRENFVCLDMRNLK